MPLVFSSQRAGAPLRRARDAGDIRKWRQFVGAPVFNLETGRFCGRWGFSLLVTRCVVRNSRRKVLADHMPSLERGFPLYAGLTSKGAPQRERSTPRRNDPSRQVGQNTKLPTCPGGTGPVRTDAHPGRLRICTYELPEAYALLLRSKHVARRTRHAGPHDRRNHSI